MTKEQILDAADEPYFIQKGTEIVVRDAALTAMDEHAKQEAIGFARWLNENNWKPSFRVDLVWEHMFEYTKATTEELYNLYLTTKDK